MHSKDPTGKLGERLPKVYEDYLKFIEQSSKSMTVMERKRNTAVKNHCLSLMAPLGSTSQARPRSEVASENRASSTTNHSSNGHNNNSTNNGTTLDKEEDTSTSNHPSSLAPGTELSFSSLQSSTSTGAGKKRKKSRTTQKKTNRKRACTRDRAQEFMNEGEGRNDMHGALTMFIQKSMMRSTMEILEDYEKVKEKYEHSTGRTRKLCNNALICLEKEMEMAETGNNDGNNNDSEDSDSDSDSNSN